MRFLINTFALYSFCCCNNADVPTVGSIKAFLFNSTILSARLPPARSGECHTCSLIAEQFLCKSVKSQIAPDSFFSQTSA